MAVVEALAPPHEVRSEWHAYKRDPPHHVPWPLPKWTTECRWPGSLTPCWGRRATRYSVSFGAVCWTRIRPPWIVLCQEQICPVAIAAVRARTPRSRGSSKTESPVLSLQPPLSRDPPPLRCVASGRTSAGRATTPRWRSWSSGGFPLPTAPRV
jgi:hypothetical protein